MVATCGAAHAYSVPLGLGRLKLSPLRGKAASTAEHYQGLRAAPATAARACTGLGEVRDGGVGSV